MRIRFILILFLLIWVALLVRVFYLSVHSNSYYERLSSQNTIKTEFIAPVRGEILDRNKSPLAINKLGFKVMLRPHLRTKAIKEEVEYIVSMLPFLDPQDLIEEYRKKESHYNHHHIAVVDFVSYEDIMPVYSTLNLREKMRIEPAPKRYYPNRGMGAHVIGYVARANQKDIDKDATLKLIGTVGKSGLEKQYNTFLQGVPGERRIKVTARNEEISELSLTKPVENRNLTLTMDIRLQDYITGLFKDKAGSVIIMDTKGALLAAGSYPEYDLNSFVTGISTTRWDALINDPDTPFTNKTINGLYPPGSTIKTGMGLVYITSALNEWWYTYCTGSMKLGKRNFRCWKSTGHGKTDITKAVRESCDDYFYKGSLKVGIKTMSEGLRAFGLGKKTGIDLPNEFIGTVPSRIWKLRRYDQPWYRGETLNTSIGQGDFLTTPIQIAQYTALMAIGKLPTPHLALALGEQPYEAKITEVMTPEQTAKLPIIQRAMYQVCNHPKGTATHWIDSKVKIAGKTGTAQVVGITQATKKRIDEADMEYYTRSHAWLTTYGPASSPEYVVTVLVEHGGHGGSAAGKIVSRIYDKLYELGYIDKRQ